MIYGGFNIFQYITGVSPIHINGSDEIGATMACNGDVSCFKIFVEGLHVKSLQCNGDHSCGNSTFIMNKYTDTQSSDVKPMFVLFTGDSSAAYTTVEAYNVGSLDWYVMCFMIYILVGYN